MKLENRGVFRINAELIADNDKIMVIARYGRCFPWIYHKKLIRSYFIPIQDETVISFLLNGFYEGLFDYLQELNGDV